MDEVEKDTAEIDVIAAGLNSEAARVVSIAEKRARSANIGKGLAKYDTIRGEERAARLDHEEEIARDIAEEAEKVRDAAARIQRLAREMRRHLAAGLPDE